MRKCIPFFMVFALLLGLVGAAKAQGWVGYRLAEVRFEVPADWSLVARTRNREMSFQSADGVYQFRLSWWFPDEPLLGYDDIVAHRTIQVDGRSALLIHSRLPQRQSLQLAFEKPRADGRQLLLLLESGREDFSHGSYLFDELVNRLRFNTQSAISPLPQRSLPGVAPLPEPAQNHAPAGVLREDGGAFSIQQPVGWQRNQAERDGLRILNLVDPQRQALVLVVSTLAADGSASEAAIQAYRDLYYSDMVIPNSIEGDQDRVIGGLAGRQLEVSAEIYPVEGVRLPFTQGRSYEFRTSVDGRAYLLIGLHGEQAPPQVRQGVMDVMASFRASSPLASGDDPRASIPQQMPGLQPAPADLAALQGVFGTSCQWLSASQFHPVKDLLV